MCVKMEQDAFLCYVCIYRNVVCALCFPGTYAIINANNLK